jgi:hypothetical protein
MSKPFFLNFIVRVHAHFDFSYLNPFQWREFLEAAQYFGFVPS